MGLLNLQHLKNKYSLNVKNLAYIGANKGQDVDEFLSVFPDTKISLFEPQDELFSYLKKILVIIQIFHYLILQSEAPWKSLNVYCR